MSQTPGCDWLEKVKKEKAEETVKYVEIDPTKDKSMLTTKNKLVKKQRIKQLKYCPITKFFHMYTLLVCLSVYIQ